MVSNPKRKVLLQIPQKRGGILATCAEVIERKDGRILVELPKKWQMRGGPTEIWINDALDPIVMGWT